MSNQASLFASDSPQPCNPHVEDSDAESEAILIAGAAYAVPVFWLACFDTSNLVTVTNPDGALTTLLAPLEEARRRLASRDTTVRDLFPQNVDSWEMWCERLNTVEAEFLKLDCSEISALADSDQQFREQVTAALNWFNSGDEFDFECLLALSGIEEYDAEEHEIVFDPEEEDVERFLLGWFEDEA